MIQDIQIGSGTQVLNNVFMRDSKSAGAPVVARKLKKEKPELKSPASKSSLSGEDELALLELFGSIASSQDSISDKKKMAFGHVTKSIGAEVWFWCRLQDSKIVEESELSNYTESGCIGQYVQAMLSSRIFQIYLAQEVGAQRTVMINDGGPFSCIYTIRKMRDGSTSLFIAFRTERNAAFTERDTGVLNTMLENLPLCHEFQADVKAHGLTPKMRKVLRSLKEGHSRKQIADQLGISVNTVAAYVRDIYREYDVHSHAELIKYFSHRD